MSIMPIVGLVIEGFEWAGIGLGLLAHLKGI
jgi:hypothetical protein